ncbi:phosphoesterase PA-phosphatase related protein [Thermobaculum terrenum ATCC BAA-798]|uniref:Phosphoesterase PA-phosphatase related protein n=1 Tax=Thermobaculum terrenum (strain ATCC BAA-798 / CCMEE 7001 / YNP1) TaxID=525904 RepID=D1CBD6_THET1|nr:phosphatase PAP2 family protein [Thermobaculum terrenum]ACZ42101.1 phosphoesterase PA-phosphatase related protein [Thermobaculum terrenum ATCC BAA-798]
MNSIDTQLLLKLNSMVGKNPVVDVLVQLLVNEYFVPVSLSLVLLFMWFGAKELENLRWKLGAINAAIGVGIANIIVATSNIFYFRDRPFMHLDVNLLFYRPTDSSFPSNAAAVAMALAIGISLHDKRLAPLVLPLAASIGIARVMAGVHYPSDVLAGWIVGALAAFIALLITNFLRPFIERLILAAKNLGLA